MRTDVDQIPIDGSRVIVATMRGEILISRLLPSGRWSGMATGDWPVAWLDKPQHPYFPEARLLTSGEVIKCNT